MNKQIPIKAFMVLIGFLLIPEAACSAEKAELPMFNNEQIHLRLYPRTSDQMSGFYELEVFPEKWLIYSQAIVFRESHER